MQQLEKLCPEILKISRADSARGRYQSKWKVWEETLSEMSDDEKNIVTNEEMRDAFAEVDLEAIKKNNYEWHIK